MSSPGDHFMLFYCNYQPLLLVGGYGYQAQSLAHTRQVYYHHATTLTLTFYKIQSSH